MRVNAICCAPLLLLVWLAPPPASAQPPGSAAGPGTPAAAELARQLPLFATRQNVFHIPFSVDRRVAQPVEVHLFVSVDQGATWQLSSRQPPAARQFSFRARSDGEYWFASRTVDASQRASDHEPLRPELRVVVDTLPPQIECAARATDSGEVVARWQAVDQNLLASSLKVEYQDTAGQPWKPVALPQAADEVLRSRYDGQTNWNPETRAAAINVRIEVRDRAGNLAVVNRRVALPNAMAASSLRGGLPAARLDDPFARPGQPSEGAVTWPSDNAPDTATAPAPPAAPLAPPPATVAGTPVDGSPSVAPSTPPAQEAQNQFASARGTDLATAGAADPQLPSDSPPAASGEGTLLPAGERPQVTNARRFQLDYDITSVGPDGVAEVQLWATSDGGQSWRLWGTDDDQQSPFDVVVDEEGVFGFHVVVAGRNGLVGRKPRSGDLADIWVNVDTTQPAARLTGAVYGEGAQIGKLFIRWEATDLNLDNRPVTLQYAEQADGPWTIIASGLPNSGEHAWPADPQTPSQIYLRLEVRDAAGNTAVDQLKEPIELEGLAPKARIRGLQPVHELDREAFRQPRRS